MQSIPSTNTVLSSNETETIEQVEASRYRRRHEELGIIKKRETERKLNRRQHVRALRHHKRDWGKREKELLKEQRMKRLNNIQNENAILKEKMKLGEIVVRNDSMLAAVLNGDSERVSELIEKGDRVNISSVRFKYFYSIL